MAASATGRLALMAIHPIYASGILDGNKQVEFRKRSLAADVTVVLMYSTAPVQKIVGAFSISETVIGGPQEIWEKFGDVGLIEQAKFDAYYEGSQCAVALVVDRTCRFDDGFPLNALTPSPATPQSFSYLTSAQAASFCMQMQGSTHAALFDTSALCGAN